MTTFVAIHGAFRGGWSWDLVATELRELGHHLLAPDLPGMGSGTQQHGEVPRPRITLSDWVGTVEHCVAEAGPSCCLVGHSMGGVVVQAALGSLGGRVAHAVVIDSPQITVGQRAIDVSSPVPIDPAILPAEDAWLPATPVSEVQGFRSAELRDWVNARLCATPFGPQLDPCPEGSSPSAPLQPTFVFCSHTPAGYPSQLTRQRFEEEGYDFLEIDSGHDAPLLAPRVVAELLTSQVASGGE